MSSLYINLPSAADVGGKSTSNTTNPNPKGSLINWSALGSGAINAVNSYAPGGGTGVGNVLTTVGQYLPGWYGLAASALGTVINFGWGANRQPYRQQMKSIGSIGFGGSTDNVMNQLQNTVSSYNLKSSDYGFARKDDYKRDRANIELEINSMYRRGGHALDNALLINTFNQLRNQSAYGGPMMFGPDFMDVSTPIGYLFASDNAALQRLKYNNKFTAPMFSLGGGFSTHGSDFTNHLIHVDAGGTHEGNPNEGVPMGTDGQGGQNLVEEGETVYRSNILGEGGYVFSERLYVPKFDPKQYKQYEVLPYEAKIMKKYGGYTFAEASKKAEKDAFGIKGKDSNSAGNVGDPISKQMNNKVQEVLKQLQEQEREKERLQQMQEAIALMSPEQRELMAMLMQQQLAAQEQAYQQQMALEMGAIPQEQDLEAEELVDYRDPRSNPLTDGRIQLAVPEEAMGALGGYLYGDGGETSIRRKLAKGWYDNTIGAVLNLINLGAQQGVFGGGSMAGAGAGGTWYPVSTQPPNNKRFEGIPVPYRNFNDAYAEARRQGKKTFEFNGKTYSTAYDTSNDPDRAKAHEEAGKNRQEWTVLGRWKDKKAEGGPLYTNKFGDGGPKFKMKDAINYLWNEYGLKHEQDYDTNSEEKKYILGKYNTVEELEQSPDYKAFTLMVVDFLKRFLGQELSTVKDYSKEEPNWASLNNLSSEDLDILLYIAQYLYDDEKHRGVGTATESIKDGKKFYTYKINPDAAQKYEKNRTDGKLGIYHFTPNVITPDISDLHISKFNFAPSVPSDFKVTPVASSLELKLTKRPNGDKEANNADTNYTEELTQKAEKAVKRYYRRNKINPNNVNLGLLLSDIERYLQTGDFNSLEINNYKLNGRVSSTRTQELNNLPQVKHRDLISQLNQLPLDENGNYVLSDARNLVRANDYSLKDNKFVGKDGVAVDPTTAAFLFSDAIKQPIQSAIDSTTGKPYFANQDELTRYYRDLLYPFFDKIGFKGVGEKPERGENYLTDEDYWNKALDYYVHGHLNKENLNKFIGELEKGDEKQKYLAEIIRNNVNFDYTGKLKPNLVKESDAYIKAVKDANAEARTKGEKEPFDEAKATDSYIGQKHPPLLAAQQAVEQNAPEVRRVLMGLDANGELDPNVIYQNYDWNSNALGLNYAEPTHIIPAPEGADSGYITLIYGVGPQKVNNNIIKIGDLWYSIPEGMEGQFKSLSNPKEKLNVTSPNTIEHTENYYTLDDNAPADTNDIALRKLSIVPAIALAGLGAIGGLASILLNKERPIKQISVPITKTRNFHPVEVLPDYVDRNFTTNKLIAQGNAGIRQAVNLSGGNSGVARAAALANNANLLNSIGEADYKGWLQNIQNRLEADKLNMSLNLEYDKLNTQIDSDYNNNLIKLAGLNANFIDAQNKLNWQRNLEMQKGIGAGLSTIGAAINRFDETDFRNWYDYWYLKSGAYRGANGGR